MLEIRQKQGSRGPGPGCAPFANSRVQQIASPVSIGCTHGAESGSPVQLQQRRTQTRAFARRRQPRITQERDRGADPTGPRGGYSPAAANASARAAAASETAA